MKLPRLFFINASILGVVLFLLQVGANYLYEPRSAFANFILGGSLLVSILFLVLLGAFVSGIYFLFKVKLRKAFALLFWSGILLTVLGFGLYWDLTGLHVLKEDRIVYTSALQKDEKLILQYYETGVTGNPNWRAILVQGQYHHFRRHKHINLDLFSPESEFELSIGDGIIHYAKLPKTLSVDGKQYLLEQTFLFDGQKIIEPAKPLTR